MKRIIIQYAVLLGVLCSFQVTALQAAGWGKDTLEFFSQATNELMNDIGYQAKDKQHCMQQEQEAIASLLAAGLSSDDLRVQMAKDRYDSCKAAADGFQKVENKVASGFGEAFNFMMAQGQLEVEASREKEKIMLKGILDNEAAKERLQMWFNELKNPETLGMIATYGALTVFGIAAAYYSAKFSYDYAQTRLHDLPPLIRQTSVVSQWQALRHYAQSFFIDKPKQESIDDVVIDPAIQDQINFISESTKSIKASGDFYNNVLLQGPPGTGKTMYAKRLAKLSGLDFAMMNGADVAQLLGSKEGNNEAVRQLNNVFDWANKSKKGVLLFIDEADACFAPRSNYQGQPARLDVVNVFLGHTGEPSKNFMLVLATNNKLDTAIESRCSQRVIFGLPTQVMREQILQKKLAWYCHNDKRIIMQNGKKVVVTLALDESISGDKAPVIIKEIAEMTIGLSGRELERIILNARTRAFLLNQTKPCLTADLLKKAVQVAVQQNVTSFDVVGLAGMPTAAPAA